MNGHKIMLIDSTVNTYKVRFRPHWCNRTFVLASVRQWHSVEIVVTRFIIHKYEVTSVGHVAVDRVSFVIYVQLAATAKRCALSVSCNLLTYCTVLRWLVQFDLCFGQLSPLPRSRKGSIYIPMWVTDWLGQRRENKQRARDRRGVFKWQIFFYVRHYTGVVVVVILIWCECNFCLFYCVYCNL